MVKLARRQGDFDCKKIYVHAEIDAIIKCKDIHHAYSIEIYRYSNHTNTYGSSKPCDICMSGIQNTPIKKITYMFNNNFVTEIRKGNKWMS